MTKRQRKRRLRFWLLLLVIAALSAYGYALPTYVAAGRINVIVLFFSAALLLQYLIAIIGLHLAHERFRYLMVVPMTRIVYGPLRTYLIYRSVLTMLRGVYVGWNKFARTQTINVQHSLSFQEARSGAKK